MRAALDALARVTADARDEAAGGGESKAEGKYDTRATEASYLAAGQGQRLADLKALAEWLDALDPAVALPVVAPGALVELDRGGEAAWVLVGPQGGHRVNVDGAEVLLVSADSPLGQVLAGLAPGDAEEVDTPRGVQVVEVLSVE